MNPIEEILMMARAKGMDAEKRSMEQRLREAEARALKAENEAEELRRALTAMEAMKIRYQGVVTDMMATLERHGLVQ